MHHIHKNNRKDEKSSIVEFFRKKLDSIKEPLIHSIVRYNLIHNVPNNTYH